jgi:hypothetical protein
MKLLIENWRKFLKEDEWSPPRSRDDVKYGGKIHLIPGVRFTGDISADIQGLPSEILNWMWGDLESGDAIEDEFGRNYAGADVQDAVQELPDELFERKKD